ncbi:MULTISPECIES: ABC transporter permease [Rhodovulum]|uniref:ABC-type polysaccharide/polyol phosphate export permease n=2 Tax=Rhodovulum TaxID=34008 RepID=A0A8E2VH29_9RHOB|nr:MULTISPECIES: ABC transporter permease [Rhodovulum]PTW43865.1 ABC-type polysaccharide/polyol phosphate export permease [Rhodovulum kholense]RAP39728.1 ABC transporter permease [Rhodovulum viride]
MFQTARPTSTAQGGLRLLALIYHASVRHVRKSHRNAVMGLIMNILQTVLLVVSFYVMFNLVGLRGAAIRGDFLVYLMSGVFLFMTFNKTMAAVVGSEGPASPMMQHAPMNTIIAIAAAALGTLYIQILSMLFVGFVYHAAFTPITVDRPVGAMGMLLLAWFSGLSVGMVFLALKPWAPGFVGLASTVFQRMNMIASGKMFVANTLPGYMLVFFDWNPLFHCIDQARGYAFVNYNPHFTSVGYPLRLAIALTMIGLMGEFYTRKFATASWYARR